MRITNPRIYCYHILLSLNFLSLFAIIAILAAILLPSLKLAHEKAKQTICASNMKQNFTSFCIYSSDYTDYYPQLRTIDGSNGDFWHMVLYTHITGRQATEKAMDNSIYKCPKVEKYSTWYPGIGMNATIPSVILNLTIWGDYVNKPFKLHALPSPPPAQWPLVGNRYNNWFIRSNLIDYMTFNSHGNQGNVLYCDGHVIGLSRNNWTKIPE